MNTNSTTIEAILSNLNKVKKSGDGWIACCPAHDDKNPSLKISIGDNGNTLFHCKAGCTAEQICTAIGIQVKDLFPQSLKPEKHTLTIEELAQAKSLPVDFLKSLGVLQAENGIIIPYLDKDGKPARQRKRTHLVAKEGSFWEGKGQIIPYGPWLLAQRDMIEEISIVEGESDTWTLYYCGFPVLGIPGAQMTKILKADHLQGIIRVDLVEESDQGGENFIQGILARLKEIAYRGEISIVQMKPTGVKDVNDLYRKLEKEKFQEAYHNLLSQAIPQEAYHNLLSQAIPVEQKPIEERLKLPNPTPTIEIKSLQSLKDKVFPPVKWVIPGILPEGATILAGNPKMGKSILALNLALSVAYGGVALGKISVEKGNVLYLVLEDWERRLQDRVQRIMAGQEWPKDFDYSTWWPTLNKGGLSGIEQWLQEHPQARLVIVDTLARVRSFQKTGENIYDRDYHSVVGLKQLADTYHVAILIIHHTRKADANDALELISGSFGLSGSVDGALILKRERGKADAVLAITGRDIEEKELALGFKFPIWELLGDAEEFRISKERQTILSILRESNTPMSPKEITQVFQTKHPKANYYGVAKLLERMTKAGEIKCSEYGKYEVAKLF